MHLRGKVLVMLSPEMEQAMPKGTKTGRYNDQGAEFYLEKDKKKKKKKKKTLKSLEHSDMDMLNKMSKGKR